MKDSDELLASNESPGNLSDSGLENGELRQRTVNGVKQMRKFEKPVKKLVLNTFLFLLFMTIAYFLHGSSKTPASPQNNAKKGKTNRKWVEGDEIQTLDYTDKSGQSNGNSEEPKENLAYSQYASVSVTKIVVFEKHL